MKKQEKVLVVASEYMCRRCKKKFTKREDSILGEFYSNVEKLNMSDAFLAEIDRLMGKAAAKYHQRASLYELHTCADEGRGLGDLIGCTPPQEMIIKRRKTRSGEVYSLVKPE